MMSAFERLARELCAVLCRYLTKSPMTGEYDLSNVGRTPNAAEDAEYPEANKKEVSAK